MSEYSLQLSIINKSFHRNFLRYVALIKTDAIQKALIEAIESNEKSNESGENTYSSFVEVKAPHDSLHEDDPCYWRLSKVFSPKELAGEPFKDQLNMLRYYDLLIEIESNPTIKVWWRLKLEGNLVRYRRFGEFANVSDCMIELTDSTNEQEHLVYFPEAVEI